MNMFCAIIPHLRLIVVTTQIAASYLADRLRTIYEKLHVTNRTQAALYALRHGWATLDEPPSE